MTGDEEVAAIRTELDETIEHVVMCLRRARQLRQHVDILDKRRRDENEDLRHQLQLRDARIAELERRLDKGDA